ncbi:sensor histidine kinase [Thermoflexibacter ruber]|uniref:Histidine kinase n=1 Tax=Thermoflexibacter ruber TaxID=1003 RepID=A0A1I2C416_9BACT|nr:sensor histidine kinase [Thermoflexibacter ruber]SFE62948.1 Histidine kinase [Thermoflexibacter ruber]
MKIKQIHFTGAGVFIYIIFFTSVLNIIYQLHHALILMAFGGFFHLLIIYLNNYQLIPKFLKKRKYFIYILLVIVLLFSLSWVRAYLENKYLLFTPERFTDFNRELGSKLFPRDVSEFKMPPPRDMFRGMPRRPIFFPAVFFTNLMIWLVGFSFYFVKEWFENQRIVAERQREALETELKFLKSQLHPHFLFNTLNNIYSYTYIKDDRAAPMLMKLSEMLRYMLYDSNEATVSLEKEIQFLKNFIDLQKMKSNKNQAIDFHIQGNTLTFPTAPLLLLPFFENSFKHSDLDINPKGYILTKLEVQDNQQLYFEMGNTKRPYKSNQQESSGIGLENVKKRLELLYPNRHELIIEDREDIFKVKLFLQINSPTTK